MDSMMTEQPEHSPQKAIRRGPITVDYLRRHPTVSMEQAAGLIGVSRNYCYELARSGQLDVIKLSNKRFRVKSLPLLRLLGVED